MNQANSKIYCKIQWDHNTDDESLIRALSRQNRMAFGNTRFDAVRNKSSLQDLTVILRIVESLQNISPLASK